MSDEMPHSVSQSTLSIMGVDLVVHQLSNGQRIIEEDGVHALFAAMAVGPMSQDEADIIARMLRS